MGVRIIKQTHAQVNEKIHKRGCCSAEFKEKVALDALSGAKTHVQIASDYDINPDPVKDRKKQATEKLIAVPGEMGVADTK